MWRCTSDYITLQFWRITQLLKTSAYYDYPTSNPFAVIGNITLYPPNWPSTTKFTNIPGLSVSGAKILVSYARHYLGKIIDAFVELLPCAHL